MLAENVDAALRLLRRGLYACADLVQTPAEAWVGGAVHDCNALGASGRAEMRLSDGGSRAMVGRRQWRLWRITDVSLELMMRCWGKAEVLGLRQEHRGV